MTTGVEVNRQRAFVGLLAEPVVDRQRNPELFGLVRDPRHRPELMSWFASRLGYRLVVTDTWARVFRLPIQNQVIAPRRLPVPSRRTLVLALLAAAVSEDTEDITSTQDLSDRVRILAARDDIGVAAYDPDRFTERKLFAASMALLISTGALVPVGKAGDEHRDGWTRRTDKVGGTYRVERDMLLRLVDPANLDAALGKRPTLVNETADRFAVMRRLIELPVCYYDDLTKSERSYLIRQRSRVVAWCTEMTGWTVEQRSEGLALIASDEAGTDLPFPRLRAIDFVSLMVLDRLYRCRDDSGVVTEADVVAAVEEVALTHPKSITADIAAGSARRERALELLAALDLLRPGLRPGLWQLTPIAARYRDPRVVSVTSRMEDCVE